jgi:hypothetical protein
MLWYLGITRISGERLSTHVICEIYIYVHNGIGRGDVITPAAYPNLRYKEARCTHCPLNMSRTSSQSYVSTY